MKLQISHQTSYYYEKMALKSVQYIRMTPRSIKHQTIHNWQLLLPALGYYQDDGFGNTWTVLTRNEKHNNLQIQANGLVEIDTETEYLPAGRVNPLVYTMPTSLTDCDEQMREFAANFLQQPSLQSVRDFAAALLDKVPYTPGSTFVSTTASQAFDQQQGVCQDHSHIFIACLRQFGIPARYASGYLFTEQQHLDSHAWAEAFIDNKWHTFDVSNQLFAPTAHVYVAFGRDYNDAAPIRGTRQGGGEETMNSNVLVDIIVA